MSGSGASRTLVVADGWALNDPFGSWVYWNGFRSPRSTASRSCAGRRAIHGSDALGGVIQVLTLDTDRPRLRGLFEAGRSTPIAPPAGGRRFGNWAVRRSGVVEHQRRLRRRRRGPWRGRRAGVQRLSVRLWHRRLRQRNVARDASRQPRQRGPRQRHAGAGQQHRVAQISGEFTGALAGGFWTARVTGGSQDYFQTFSAIAPDRQTERLTNDQTVPDDFFTVGGQWMRTWKAADVLIGAEARQTTADLLRRGSPSLEHQCRPRTRISKTRTHQCMDACAS